METLVRKSADRGHASHGGWLNAKHTFSFADYHDPQWMMFRSLRVMNQDIIAPEGGFPKHPHRDMEIITFVIRGQIQHGDSMGNSSIIKAGDIQLMGAGTGVIHSEFNPSKTEELELLQLWIIPDRQGLPPRYEQKKIAETPLIQGMRCLASKDGAAGSLVVNQDLSLYAGKLGVGATLTFATASSRFTWVQLVQGALTVAGTDLEAGDGIAISDAREIAMLGGNGASAFLLFDMG